MTSHAHPTAQLPSALIGLLAVQVRYTVESGTISPQVESALMKQLEWIPNHLSGEGLLTGETPAVVDISANLIVLARLPILPDRLARRIAEEQGGFLGMAYAHAIDQTDEAQDPDDPQGNAERLAERLRVHARLLLEAADQAESAAQ